MSAAAAAAQGNGEYFPMWAGQSIGLIHDLPGAADAVHSLVSEARTVLDTFPRVARTA